MGFLWWIWTAWRLPKHVHCWRKEPEGERELERVRGIEPPSESMPTQFSPSASMVLGFPSPHAPWRACGYGSFIFTGSASSFGVLVPRFNDTVCLTSGRSGTARGITPRKRIRYCQLLFFPVVARYSPRLAYRAFIHSRRNQNTPMWPPIHAGEARVPFRAWRRARRRRRACRAGACPGTGPAPASSARP